MKQTEMRALSNRGTMRTPLARASAWLLSRLGAGSCRDTAGWVSAREIETARSQTGVSRSALNKARRSLQKTGHIEKRRRGYQGPWRYRVVASTSRHCPLCGAVNGVPAQVEPVPEAKPTQPAVAIRYVGPRSWCADQLYGTGLMWHGHGDIQPVEDTNKARRMARNHPDIYALVEVEPLPTADSAQPAVAIRYVGRRSRHEDQLYGTGLVWHGPGDIQPVADRNKADRMARNHPDVYEVIEVESD